ncbi:hypothetical protein BVX97_02280 [bacterium E08(2017)]|nr:hypothetical protein BVX97_02280 [bacterium E08(2017)]
MKLGAEQVLLVEDDLCEAKLFCRVIQNESDHRFVVQKAFNLREALEALKNPELSIVVTDLSLPDSQGVDTFKTIHQARPEIAVVILTGIRDEQFAIETVRCGAQDYLVKGRDNGTMIVRALRYAIERKRVDEEWRKLISMREQERRLEALGSIASGLAHEISTPLQFVGNNISFMRRAYSKFEELLEKVDALILCKNEGANVEELEKEIATLIHDEKYEYLRSQTEKVLEETTEGIKRVHEITKAMRVFSRGVNHSKIRYDINRAVRDALTVSRNEWKDWADIRMNLDDGIPAVECEPGEVSQAILNLLTNASHSIKQVETRKRENGGDPHKGMIEVSTKDLDGYVEIEVTDSGDGIPEDIKPRIFEPFFTTKDVDSGTGQGLPIVHNIVVKKHGGRIDYETEIGKGTKFKLVLPVDSREVIEEKEPDHEVAKKSDDLNGRIMHHVARR